MLPRCNTYSTSTYGFDFHVPKPITGIWCPDESVFAGTSIVATIVCSRDNKIIPKKGNANINNLATNSPVVVVLYLFFKDAMFIMFRMLKIHVVSYLETHVRCGLLQ